LPSSLDYREIKASAGSHQQRLTSLKYAAIEEGVIAPSRTSRRMAAQFVVPYRKRSKDDADNAEAVGRPNMYFVAIKS
jgi:hypothetical protein